MNLKPIIPACIALLIGCSQPGQDHRSWTAFWNEDATRMGFRDPDGSTRIEPRYSGFTTARKFDDIVAVMEDHGDRQEAYYLTKSGDIIGRDTIYFVDNGPDCESEGFIRFRDRRTGLAGLYDGAGGIAVPAEYNDITNVRNGMAAALKGARKKAPGAGREDECGHVIWEGGREYLIDTRNRVLVDGFPYDPGLNFYSLTIRKEPAPEKDRRSFRGVDGNYYSFVDYKKEFQAWLTAVMGGSFSRETLMENSCRDIYFWKEPDGWAAESSRSFIDLNFELIRSRLSEWNKENAGHFIAMEGLNPFIFKSAEFDPYYNNCGEPKDWQYPVMSLVIQHQTGGDSAQDQFDFLRTENGYKLISVAVRNVTPIPQ